jgi:hypothetical protein
MRKNSPEDVKRVWVTVLGCWGSADLVIQTECPAWCCRDSGWWDTHSNTLRDRAFWCANSGFIDLYP